MLILLGLYLIVMGTLAPGGSEINNLSMVVCGVLALVIGLWQRRRP